MNSVLKSSSVGGTMVDAPSYLKKVFLILRVGKGEYLDRNCKRVAALWMDEYTY